jgi:hypothetical protein
MLRISIPNPCHEDWNKMSPRDQGAYCGVCCKTVVDFTALSDDQVKNYFLQNREGRTCGRFRSEQLDHEPDYLPKLLSVDIPVWKKFLAAVVIIFAGLLTSCSTPTKGKVVTEQPVEMVAGMVSLPESDLGDVVVPDTGRTLIETQTATYVTTLGEIAIEPPTPVVGELVMGAPTDTIELEPDTASMRTIRVVDFCLDEEPLPKEDSNVNSVFKKDSIQKKSPKKDSVKYYLDPE